MVFSVLLAWLQAFTALPWVWQRNRSALAIQSTLRCQLRRVCLCCGSSSESWPSRGRKGRIGETRGCWHVVPSLCDSIHSVQFFRQSEAGWRCLGRLQALTHSLRAALFPFWRDHVPYWLYDQLYRLLCLSHLWVSVDIGGHARPLMLFGVFFCRLRKARKNFLANNSVR